MNVAITNASYLCVKIMSCSWIRVKYSSNFLDDHPVTLALITMHNKKGFLKKTLVNESLKTSCEGTPTFLSQGVKKEVYIPTVDGNSKSGLIWRFSALHKKCDIFLDILVPQILNEYPKTDVKYCLVRMTVAFGNSLRKWCTKQFPATIGSYIWPRADITV